MRLKDLEIFVVGTPPGTWGGRYFIFVKVTSDDGITGFGEVYAASVGPTAMRAIIEDVFARHMAGESAENVELMFRRAYSAGFTQRPDLSVMGAFSGLSDSFDGPTHHSITDIGLPVAQMCAHHLQSSRRKQK